MSNLKIQLGFTLIELLVVVTILLLLIGGAIASFSNFKQKQLLTVAGQMYKNGLRDAQSRAYNGQKDPVLCSGLALVGWTVRFNVINGFDVFGTCGATTFGSQSYSLANSSAIVATTNPGPIQFTSFPKGALVNGLQQSGTVCLSNTAIANLYYKLIVDPSGNITDYGLKTICP